MRRQGGAGIVRQRIRALGVALLASAASAGVAATAIGATGETGAHATTHSESSPGEGSQAHRGKGRGTGEGVQTRDRKRRSTGEGSRAHRSRRRSRSSTSSSHGLTARLTATPDRVKRGAVVRLRLAAHARHATGALAYELAYGDGTKAPPIVIPEYCRAGNPPPAAASWHFSHRYRSAGRYRVTAVVEVNCGGGHVRVSLPVQVR